MSVAELIADMVRQGVDPDLIGRTAELLAEKRPMSNAERQAKYRERQRELQESNESVTPVTDLEEKEKRTKKEKEPPISKEKPPKGGKKKSSSPRAARLPEGWVLPEDWGDWAVGEGMATEQVLREEEKFRDYWLGVGGEKSRKVNWEATWRNWIRRAME